ncbi:hypothetical protein P168DRAFT_305179 [Aspergillus campestris IBT 28561]|uniref:Uncharacterized protein n=1 Tax=Aspergillus campestris (strain IBT 28561) TaxID=1392248 RepID=A0A2I1D1W0_ASPC2|nr:uncharacterized protein P168DRAFT_305179 [Aspergillus campestris IBT 28561]PKY03873.1 hypothetical protein P168DRAFT_305179 [Aspergillus campestris IBT 28561]
MNTIRSTWVGWGTLCVAGGGAYYFAKKSINSERASRYEAEVKRKAQMAALEAEDRRKAATLGATPTSSGSAGLNRGNIPRGENAADNTNSPSVEASLDPAPTRHEPLTEAERVSEKGKYEAARPFRPPPGNRFS